MFVRSSEDIYEFIDLKINCFKVTKTTIDSLIHFTEFYTSQTANEDVSVYMESR